MAEEDKELDLEIEEDAKPKSKLIIIIVVVVLLLGGIGVGAMLLLGGEEEEAEEEEAEDAVAVKAPAIYIPMKPAFVVNFATPGAQRFLQIEVNLMTRNGAVVNIVEQHTPLIRNNLVALFSSQEFEEVVSSEGKEALRQAALEEVQRIIEEEMGDPGIEQVLFTSFVIQ